MLLSGIRVDLFSRDLVSAHISAIVHRLLGCSGDDCMQDRICNRNATGSTYMLFFMFVLIIAVAVLVETLDFSGSGPRGLRLPSGSRAQTDRVMFAGPSCTLFSSIRSVPTKCRTILQKKICRPLIGPAAADSPPGVRLGVSRSGGIWMQSGSRA